MKHLEYKKIGKDERRVRIVDISERDAEVLNESHDNDYGDFKLLYRKATSDDLAYFGVEQESEPEPEPKPEPAKKAPAKQKGGK